MKKILIGLAPVLATAAFAVSPALAQAAGPHWYSSEPGGTPVLIPAGEAVAITSHSSSLTLTVTSGPDAGAAITCEENNEGTVENPTGGGNGVDSITSLTFSGCTNNVAECPTSAATAVTPVSTSLNAAGEDTINGIKGTVTIGGAEGCPGTLPYEGSVTGATGSSTLTFTKAAGLVLAGAFTTELNGVISLEGPEGDEEITTGP